MHSKIFSPGHVDVTGNERVDSLAGDAAIDKNLTHQDPEEGMINSSQDIKARKMCGFTPFSLALLLETGTNCPLEDVSAPSADAFHRRILRPAC